MHLEITVSLLSFSEEQAEASIREDIEIFYNRQRRHSRLDYVAPAVFAQNFSLLKAAA